MFRKAVAEAAKFTFPVVMSRRTVGGDCAAGTGTFVVVNDDGWIVTAGHIFSQIQMLKSQSDAVADHRKRADTIRNSNLNVKDKSQALKNLSFPPAELTEIASAWWGEVGTGVDQIQIAQGIDLALAHLIDFEAAKVLSFPTFKNDSNIYEPGVSLCRLGYPFFQEKPSFDDVTKQFIYAPDALPPKKFPNDGILTRTQRVQVVDQAGTPIAVPYVTMNIETSTPGLPGQSGGPMFDVDGHVWGIQSTTSHTLGFSPELQINGKKCVEHQLINLGFGPASVSVIDFMNQFGIKFQSAP